MTTIDSEHLTKFLIDHIIIRIVHILDITTLSILELLEYDLTRKDINQSRMIIKEIRLLGTSKLPFYLP